MRVYNSHFQKCLFRAILKQNDKIKILKKKQYAEDQKLCHKLLTHHTQSKEMMEFKNEGGWEGRQMWRKPKKVKGGRTTKRSYRRRDDGKRNHVQGIQERREAGRTAKCKGRKRHQIWRKVSKLTPRTNAKCTKRTCFLIGEKYQKLTKSTLLDFCTNGLLTKTNANLNMKRKHGQKVSERDFAYSVKQRSNFLCEQTNLTKFLHDCSTCQTPLVPKWRFVCKGGERVTEQNCEILRISNLNQHSFTNCYSIHKPFMGRMHHMYIFLVAGRGARVYSQLPHILPPSKLLESPLQSNFFQRSF